jgi:hypothetical protein
MVLSLEVEMHDIAAILALTTWVSSVAFLRRLSFLFGWFAWLDKGLDAQAVLHLCIFVSCCFSLHLRYSSAFYKLSCLGLY